MLDRDITTTSGDASTEQHIFSSFRVLQPDYSQKLKQVYMKDCVVAIYSLTSIHFLV